MVMYVLLMYVLLMYVLLMYVLLLMQGGCMCWDRECMLVAFVYVCVCVCGV